MSTRDDPWPDGTPGWVELTTPEPDAAAEFYRDVFDWRLVGAPQFGDGYWFALTNGRPTAGVAAAVPPESGPDGERTPAVQAVWTTYFAVDDVVRTCVVIRQHAGKVLAAPQTIGTQGRVALVADPSGGVFGLWQAVNHIGSQVVNEPGAYCWNELLTPAPAIARPFFSDVFGFLHAPAPGGADYTMIAGAERHAPAIGGIGRLPSSERDRTWAGRRPFWMTYFAVKDTDGAAGRVITGGGKVMVEPHKSPYGRLAVCRDPHGALFSILKLPARR